MVKYCAIIISILSPRFFFMYGHKLKTLFLNPRMFAILCLGFSSGLPLALTGSTLQAWYTEAGVSVVTIGILSLIGMPYVWKFLWAPLMDRYALLGDRRRGWIMLTQLSLCATLFFISTYDPKVHPYAMGFVALLVAFFSASQDVSIDAYRADVLPVDERGIGSAYYIFAYRMAMLVSGGVVLVIADHLGFRTAYQIMAVIIGLASIITYFAPKVPRANVPENIFLTIKESFSDLLSRPSIGILLLFVIFYKLGDALAVSLISNFLLHGLGFSLTEVGLAFKTVSIIGTLTGAFIGGALLATLGLYRSLLWFGLAQAVSTLSFMVLAMAGKNFGLMVGCVFIENFCSGMGTTAFMAFLMSLCNLRYTATQYACLSALASVGRVYLGPVAGLMVASLGWTAFYAWSFALSLPGLLLLMLLRTKVSFNAEMAEC
jgi:MFS transporter, PAT family, beta-lactamase induction signal transducer AmpG